MILTVMVVGSYCIVPSLPLGQTETQAKTEDSPTIQSIPEDLLPLIQKAVAEDNPNLPANYDLGNILGDRDNDYQLIYEPWRSRAAIHAVSYDQGTGFLALAGGYLYDNEIHVFRLNVETNQFDKVWDTGDRVFKSDVMSIDFGDTDLNDFIEIVAGCADGHVYVFEQRHLYDPFANTENQFDLVWTSPMMFRAFAVKVDDIDRDYRPDIIAGGWDGKVHIYEYLHHSGYPFVVEHWITYEEVATLDVGDKVYTLETGDTNGNGLPEVIVGTRNGKVLVYENAGITMWINGFPFPLIYDNHYYLNWTSEEYTWTPIISMAVGELDGSLGDEIALVAQGQGVLTLDWNSVTHTYDYQKVYRSFVPWETFGFWGLDYWADRIVSANNVTYHDPLNASINVAEPIQYVWGGSYFVPDASVYPYNTGMATYTDGNYSTFDSSLPGVDNATAIIDFGLDEEGTGSANAKPDVIITFRYNVPSNYYKSFNFSVSKDGTDFEQVSYTNMVRVMKELRVDVDDALGKRNWDYFRYAKISVYADGNYQINSLRLAQVYNLVTEALSVTIGPLREDSNAWYSGIPEQNKILVGTVIGELIGIKYNVSTSLYDLFWESGDDDYYTFGANIWDIEYVGTPTTIPTWNWRGGVFMNPLPGYDYQHWSWGILDPFPVGETTFSMLMAMVPEAGGSPEVHAYDYTGAYDSVLSGYMSVINFRIEDENHEWDSVSIEAPYLPNPTYGGTYLPMIAVGGINNDIPVDSIWSRYHAGITFFYRSTVTSTFSPYVELWQLDYDGQLTGLVNLAETTPRMDFMDIDEDGDSDFVVSTGHLYLAKNIIETTGLLNFTLVPGYFDDINNLETSAVWGQPEMVDLDGDGDRDLILSYDNKMGATAFINEGTQDDPVWVEMKKITSNPGINTNMKLLNLTDTRVIPDFGPYWQGYFLEQWIEAYGLDRSEFYLYSYNPYNKGVFMNSPEYEATDSYVIATYPRVARLDLSLLEPAANKYWNLGFHVMETWNNDFDLEDWTLSVTSADTDQDGNNEVIVGDYDNNVYAFEHLVNNTYKRMFRSFDINHTEVSDVSPYYYGELEGISGDFNRRIWDHVDHLVADVDLDQDGLKEIIAAAYLQVYIFEEIGLTGGDAMRFVYSFDLRETDWGGEESFVNLATSITAMTGGSDLDYDGRKELVVAAGPYLFVYNVNHDSFDNMEGNDFFMTSISLEGRYYMIGNGYLSDFWYASIDAMTTGDTDRDGYRELIIGGIEDTQLIRQNGFVYIYECKGGTFCKAWQAPSIVTMWNPISDLEIDDQDYDGEWELIIGHTHGFDMWEHIPGLDSQYQKVEYVTASPNYPIIPLQTAMGGETYLLGNRSLKSMTHLHGNFEGWGYMVYETDGALRAKFFNKTTNTWFSPSAAFAWNYGAGTSIAKESEPDVVGLQNGDVYVTWNTIASNGSTYLWVGYWDESAAVWSKPYPVPTVLFEWGYRHSPSVFEYDTNNIGVCYVIDFIFGGNYVLCKTVSKTLTGVWTSRSVTYENSGDLQVHDAKMIRLEDGSFALGMSATNLGIDKLDHDIWVVVGNSSFSWTDRLAHQATTGFYDEMYVDIDYLRSEDKSLVVMYEQVGAPIEDRFGMAASQNQGATWSIPETVNSLPKYVERVELDGYVWYEWVGTNITLPQPMSYSPALLPLDNGGFMYTITFTLVLAHVKIGDIGWYRYVVGDIDYGINLQSDWALNHLRNVVDLDVGDTDMDHRREVVVAFDNQLGVYELKSSNNGTDFMEYEEAWLSEPYENRVTGVTVSDSNGNGWDDIALSCKRGDVFFLEYVDPSEGASPLMGSSVSWSVQTSGWGDYSGWNSLQNYDIDNDSKDEVVAAQFNSGRVFAIDDDGSLLWNATGIGGGVNEVVLADLTNDTIPEVLLPSSDTTLYVLNITNGFLVWSYANPTTDVITVDVGDIDANGLVEVVFGTAGGDIWILNHNGSFYSRYGPSGVKVWQVKIANLTGSSHLDVAYADNNRRLTVINPLNGSVVYQTPTLTIAYAPEMRAHDFNDDGVLDLVFARYAATYWEHGFNILDVVTKTMFYNSSNMNTVWNIWIEDFDDDGVVEVMTSSVWGDAYLEEVMSGTVQWHYIPSETYTWSPDAQIGHLGGSGNYDLAITYTNISTLSDGVVVAIDGKNGVPMWFNLTGGYPISLGVADLDGSGVDSIISWDYETWRILAVDSYELVTPVEEEAYPVHQVYWDTTIPSGYVYGTEVADLNSDGIDEVIAWDPNGMIHLLNGTNGAYLWSQLMPFAVNKVRIGNLDGSGWLDIAALVDDGSTYTLRGIDGAQIGSIALPTSYSLVDFYAGQFNTPHANDEIAFLFQSAANAFMAWYDGNGTRLYRSTNVSALYGHMAVGRFLGFTTQDIVVGGSWAGYGAAVMYRGYDGASAPWILIASTDIYGIIAGNFTGDGYADFALEDENQTLHVVDTYAGTQTAALTTSVSLRGYYAADLDGDGLDEVVMNLERIGVRAYSYSGSLEWQYVAPLMTGSFDSTCAFADMNRDGRTDLVFTNREYINVVDGVTGLLVWHYASSARNVQPKPGHFTGSEDALGVLSYWTGTMYVVSGVLPTPTPPMYPEGPVVLSYGEGLVVAAAVGVPVVLLLIVPVLHILKRRRDES